MLERKSSKGNEKSVPDHLGISAILINPYEGSVDLWTYYFAGAVIRFLFLTILL